MPFGIVGRTGLGMRQVVGFCDRSTRRGTFGANLGRAIVFNGEFTAYVCDSVPQPSELRFGVVRAVGRGIAVLDGGQRRARERSGFGFFCSPLSQWEMPLGRRRSNVSDSYAET